MRRWPAMDAGQVREQDAEALRGESLCIPLLF